MQRFISKPGIVDYYWFLFGECIILYIPQWNDEKNFLFLPWLTNNYILREGVGRDAQCLPARVWLRFLTLLSIFKELTIQNFFI